VDARGVHQPAPEAESPGGVVVAADEDDAGAGLAEAHQRRFAQLDGVERRHGPVVDVAGDEHGVDALGPDRLDQRVQEGRLRVPQVSPVQRAAQVPVGGVQQPHDTTVGRRSDKSGSDTHQRRPGRGPDATDERGV
jgi:hypothetical protein